VIKRSSVLVLATAVMFVPAVGAQEMFIPADREASAQVARIVSDARDAGLPTDPIIGKVRYGVARMNSRPDRLVAAAAVVAQRLRIAREALDPNPTENDIRAGAEALSCKNATPSDLRAIRRVSGNRSVASALGLLAQLLSSEVPHDKAMETVTDLIKRGASPNQLAELGNEFNDDIQGGANPQTMIDIRARGLVAVLAARGISGDAVTAPAFTTGGPGTAATDGPKTPPKRP
jgi:hypothetical protein